MAEHDDILADDSDPSGEPTTREKVMGFLDHLEELRWTLLKSVIVFAIGFLIAAIFFDRAAAILRWPLDYGLREHPESFRAITSTPMAIFSVYLVIPTMVAIIVALPFVLFFIAQFVAPALTPKEKSLVLPGLIAAVLLFAAGGLFSYFLLTPSIIRFSVELNARLGSDLYWTIDKYYSMLMWLVIGMGCAFQFPLLIQALIYLDFVTVAKLRSWRRYMVLICFVIAAFITPTPDPFNMTLVALPLWFLYELAIFVGAIYTSRRSREARAEAEAS